MRYSLCIWKMKNRKKSSKASVKTLNDQILEVNTARKIKFSIKDFFSFLSIC